MQKYKLEYAAFISHFNIFQYSTKEELLEHVIDCDIVIYDITQNPDQIEEALWILDGIHSNFDRVNHQIVFILLSTVMTWAKSKPLDPVCHFNKTIMISD